MNQILLDNKKNIKRKKLYKLKKYRLILYLSLFIILILLIYYSYNYIVSKDKEKMSVSMLNSFNIQHIYLNQNNYSTVLLNNDGDFLVIGSIEIPSINIKYPILSKTTDEYLKISPCRFYGPYPNEVGNLCIAAHNYDDNRFFGNLDKLKLGDVINIYDSLNNSLDYYVYRIYETDKNDTSCTYQETNKKKEITLVTCNNLNGNRLIIKAKE